MPEGAELRAPRSSKTLVHSSTICNYRHRQHGEPTRRGLASQDAFDLAPWVTAWDFEGAVDVIQPEKPDTVRMILTGKSVSERFIRVSASIAGRGVLAQAAGG